MPRSCVYQFRHARVEQKYSEAVHYRGEVFVRRTAENRGQNDGLDQIN
jgi:hypothetical protein